MSCDVALALRGVSKCYLSYEHPQDRLKQALYPRLRRIFRPVATALGNDVSEHSYYRQYWALRGIDLEVAHGETLGVIGKNGSGKSTLLKILCGTLAPSEGEVASSGRIAALLELGSGFNPEFTGMENIYLNASVLGLSREETEARISDIVRFADIGDFVDQPVKTYSSGMAMRLAFAVIAHVDADILIIDEALAVGDAYFQQKCLRWLRQFRERGTVLFCGHDTGAILSFCHRAVWLDRGSMRMIGKAKDVCEAYNAFVQAETMGLPAEVVRIAKPRPSLAPAHPKGAASSPENSDVEPMPIARRPPPPDWERPVIFDNLEETSSFGSGLAQIVSVRLLSADGAPLSWIEGGEAVKLCAEISINADIDSPIAGFHVKDRLGQPVFGDNTYEIYLRDPLHLEAGTTLTAEFHFQMPWLQTGRYAVTVALASGTIENHIQHHWLHDALFFDVNSPFKNGVMIAIPMTRVSLQTARG